MPEQAAPADEYKTKRFRSPPYPGIPLKKAVERAEELYEKAFHHVVPMHVLANAWGFTIKSSSIGTTAAALKQFGLLSDQGSGQQRRFNLTDDAIRIIKDQVPLSEKRKNAIKQAALTPKIHAELWEKFGLAGLSGSMDATLKAYLTLDRKDAGEAPYSDDAADEVIAVYRETIAFAGLGHSDIIPELKGDDDGSAKQPAPNNTTNTVFGGAKVGDLVQWEVNGQLKFESAKRVRAIDTHEGQEWVFVDGEVSGIPMSETSVIEKGTGGAANPPQRALEDTPPAPGVWKEVTDLDEGDVVLTLPENLSPESFEDLKAWLALILRKAQRRAGVKGDKKSTDTDDIFK